MNLLRLSLLFLLLLPACVARPPSAIPPDLLTRAAPNTTNQLLLVLGIGQSRFTTAWLLERNNPAAPWRTARGPMPSVVGARGFAPPNQKREGDRRTPTGSFTITETFGTEPHAPSRLPYRLLADRDAWCEDPASTNYNQWITVDERDATTDRLKRDDNLYRITAVIDYNRNPIIPGHGSAIFMHLADPTRPSGAGTLGCVGLNNTDLQAVIAALDPAKRPMILMGRPADLTAPPR